jgi:hypothetical protein
LLTTNNITVTDGMTFIPILIKIIPPVEMLLAGLADITNPCLLPFSTQGQKNGFSKEQKGVPLLGPSK